ncbi:hypothetical protein B7P43_G08708, partial [Cryptotermes secundus]
RQLCSYSRTSRHFMEPEGSLPYSKEPPALEEMHLGNVWFQQDGATAHTAQALMTVLRAKFPDGSSRFSDEAHFHVSRYGNKQNMRYWSGNNPRELHERPLHSDKVTVWCALSRVVVIGPYFFEEDNHAVTVDPQRYVDMIKNFFEPALEEMHLGNVWFQQDGATAHTARALMTVLRAKFPDGSSRFEVTSCGRSTHLI